MRVLLQDERPLFYLQKNEEPEDLDLDLDLCDPAAFKMLLSANPDLILLVTKEGCPLCPAIKEAAEKVAEEKEIPVVEMQFDREAGGKCPTLDDELKVGPDVGLALVFKDGKEKGRRRSSGFLNHEIEQLRKLL